MKDDLKLCPRCRDRPTRRQPCDRGEGCQKEAKPTDTQTRDRALNLALRLRKAGCHDEALRLRGAVKTAEQQELMQEIGRQVLTQMVEDAERHIVVLEGRG